ncbi:MAG: tetratricopeptide repeat protein, partial [Planctomycetota bacterium]
MEHPGIAPVYSLDTGEEHPPYFAMRLIEGQTLQQEVDALHRKPSTENGRTPKADRREIFRTLKFRELLSRLLYVCKVVDFAHSRGVIHRDIKPGNIILGRHGETMLIDWGLAKFLGETSSEETTYHPFSKSDQKSEQLTHDSELVGTPAFMSPEQAHRAPNAEAPSADIFSLGATLHYLLAGLPPRGSSGLGSKQQPQPICDYLFPAATPKPLQAICRKATATNPQDRYRTAGELADDLECWLADLPVKTLPENLPTRAMRVVKRHQPWFIALSLGILGVGLIGWLYNLSLSNANKKLTEEQTRLEMARFDQERLSEQAKAHSERVTKLLISLNPNISLLPSDEIRKKLDDWLLESAKSFADNANQADSLEILRSQLEALSALGYDVECKSLIKQAIKIRKEHNQSLAPLNRFLTSVAVTTEEINTAIKLFEKDFTHEFADSSPTDRAILVSELGDCYRQAGRFDDLQKLLDEHLKTSRENLAPSQLYHVKLTELVAGLHEHRKEFLDVIRVIRESREDYPMAIGPGLSALKLDLIEARALSSLGQYAEAREMLKRMLNDLSTTVALDHPARVSVSLDYGEALFGSRQYQAALEVHNTCLNNIRSASRARRSINEADCQRAIAEDLRALGEFDEAEKYINQAIDYYRGNLPAGDRRQLLSLQEKAAIYLDAERYEEAIPLLSQVVADSEKYFGEVNSDTLEAKNKLAVAFLRTNRAEQAIELLENCFRT